MVSPGNNSWYLGRMALALQVHEIYPDLAPRAEDVIVEENNFSYTTPSGVRIQGKFHHVEERRDGMVVINTVKDRNGTTVAFPPPSSHVFEISVKYGQLHKN